MTAPIQLRPRQAAVLELVARGMPNKRIAVRLGISEHTVRNHLGGVFAGLECGDRLTAVLKAAKAGLIDLSAVMADL